MVAFSNHLGLVAPIRRKDIPLTKQLDSHGGVIRWFDCCQGLCASARVATCLEEQDMSSTKLVFRGLVTLKMRLRRLVEFVEELALVRTARQVSLKTSKAYLAGKNRVEKILHFHYLICMLLLALKRISEDREIELQTEAKLKGKDISHIQIKQVEFGCNENNYYIHCRAPILDLRRSCASCSDSLCLSCCEELSQRRTSGEINSSMLKLPDKMEACVDTEGHTSDQKGNRIYGTIRKSLIYKFGEELIEGHVYNISNIDVVSNVGAYRTTAHKYKLNFQYNTRIQKIMNIQLNMDQESYTSPEEVFNNDFNQDYLIDLIGVLIAIGKEREYEKNGRIAKVVTIELENKGFRFQISLFGTYAEELRAFVAPGNAANAIVAVLAVKVKDFNVSLQIR